MQRTNHDRTKNSIAEAQEKKTHIPRPAAANFKKKIKRGKFNSPGVKLEKGR